MARHGVDGQFEGVVDAPGAGEGARQVAQNIETPLPHDSTSRLYYSAEDAFGGRGAGGAVGERKVTFLGKTVALEHKQQVVVPGRLPGGQDPMEHRPNYVPDLRETLGRSLT